MFGTIFENVVIQSPPGVSPEQIRAIVKQSQDEYKVINRTLGGIDLEFEGNDLIVRTWERSPVKRVRRIEQFLLPAMVELLQNVTIPNEQSTETEQLSIDIHVEAPKEESEEKDSTLQKILRPFNRRGAK